MSELFEKVHDSLPVFKIDHNQHVILYTPGYVFLLEKSKEDNIVQFLADPGSCRAPDTRKKFESLIIKAKKAIQTWNSLATVPFSPECLTIHSGNECNMNCTYCYTKKKRFGNYKLVGFPDLKDVETTLHFTLKNSTPNFRKLTVVYHGSGEPAWHWHQLVECQKQVFRIAQEYKMELFSYIATNGCLSKKQVSWLSDNMNLIGISCDGPPDIQKKQRAVNGELPLTIPEVCHRIIESGGRFDIRVTITRETVTRQVEIVKYLVEECNAETIRIEPLYCADEDGFIEDDADLFYFHYEKARNYAEQSNVCCGYSGVRPFEQHGPFCDILRNTIRLTPDGLSRNCFCSMNEDACFITGKHSNGEKNFAMVGYLDKLKKMALQIPDDCHNCINVFHCSRGCPDFCIYDLDDFQHNKLNPFRCKLHKIITVNMLKKLVDNQFKELSGMGFSKLS